MDLSGQFAGHGPPLDDNRLTAVPRVPGRASHIADQDITPGTVERDRKRTGECVVVHRTIQEQILPEH